MNCIIIDDDPIVQKQLSSFVSKSELLNLKGSFTNPLEALDVIKNNNIDLVFLDIEMPEMSGLEYLKEFKSKFQIIVISGDRKYALETFEYGVTDYLLKPIDYPRFVKAVYRSIERNCESGNSLNQKSFYIKVGRKFVRLCIDDIVLINLSKETKTLITKKKSFSLLNNFFDVENLSDFQNFYKINGSYIVNLDEISDVCDNKLIFKKDYHLDDIIVSEINAKEILNSIKNNDFKSRTIS
jgi:DNA-binding LytR/AlgR family response regulator